MFDVIEIVDEKTPEALASVIERLGVTASDALSVGNSVRSDILPSLAAGVQPIWIDAHVWEYERDHEVVPTEAVIEIKNLTQLLSVIEVAVPQ